MASEFQPYVGPRPFERRDEGRFFGRERETDELLSRVIAHPVVLLYSQSGAGKTSLLNARLVPLLEKEGFDILPQARVRGLAPKGITPDEIPNIYVFNVLMSWTEGQGDVRSLAQMSLADYLRSSRRPGKEGRHVPRVAIFDQFEELFTFYPERWSDRQDFFDQVADALEDDRLMRVVFSMREDYIAELDPYVPVLPGKLRTRFRLERLHERDALEAATEPLDGTGYSFAEGVAERLVRDLRQVPVETSGGVSTVVGEYVEPVQLQVVCQTLWEKLRRSGEHVITRDALKTFGDVDKALSDFYETAVDKVAGEAGINEGRLRHWFESTLITPSGTRGTVYGGGEEVAGIPISAVKELVNQHLIRAERRGGARWYELTHDRLIEPIKASNQQWMLERSGTEQTRQRLEARADEWVRSNRDKSKLLDEGELSEARRWLESPSAVDIGYSDKLLALVQASRAAVEEVERERERLLAAEQQRRAEAEHARAEEQKQRVEEQARAAKRLRRLAAALAVMFLLALGTAVYAINQTRTAREKEREAKDALAAVQKEKERADREADEAGRQKVAAIEAAKQEEKERLRAEDLAKQTEVAKNEAEKQAQLAHMRESEAIKSKERETIARKEAQENLRLANTKIEENLRLNSELMEIQEREIESLKAHNFRETGAVLLRSNNVTEGLHYFRRAIAIYQGQKDIDEEADTYSQIAGLYLQQARATETPDKKESFDKAVEFYKLAQDIRERQGETNDLARILNYLGVTYYDQHNYPEAIKNYERALDIRKKILSPDNPELALSYSNLAAAYGRQGNHSKSQELNEQALEIKKSSASSSERDVTDNEVSNTLMTLGVDNYYQGKYAQAERLYLEALSIGERIKGPDAPELGSNLHNLAIVYIALARFPETEKFERRALSLYEKAPLKNQEGIALAHTVLARVRREQAKYAEAESLFNQSLDEMIKAKGAEDPRVGTILHYMAQFYAIQSKFSEAERLEDKALAIYSKSLNPQHWYIARSVGTKAMIYARQGKHAEAESLYKQAIAGLENSFNPNHPEIASSLNGLAKLYIDLGQPERYAEAERLLTRALAIREKMLGNEHPDVASCHDSLGLLYFKRGKNAEAEALYRKALQIKEKVFGPDHPYVAETLEGYGALLRAAKRESEAATAEARAKSIRSKYPQIISSN